jgi:ketosteroid isomerase-like protein
MKLLLPFLILSLSSFVFAQTPDRNEASILGTVSDLVTAQTAYDLKTMDRILSPDYVEISPAGEFDPRAKVLSFYSPEAKAAAAKVSAKVSVAEPSVRVYGDFAIAIVKLEYTMTAEGKPLPPRAIRATYVLRKAGKDWKIASAQYTGIRPSAPKPA